MVKLQYGYVDLFAIPVSIFPTRRKEYSGSVPGILMTSLFVVLILSFISFKYNAMWETTQDKYASQSMANVFHEGYNHFKVAEFDFLP